MRTKSASDLRSVSPMGTLRDGADRRVRRGDCSADPAVWCPLVAETGRASPLRPQGPMPIRHRKPITNREGAPVGTVCPAIRTSAGAQRVQPSCRAADGFALSEVLVAIAIIGTISAAILPFLANSMAVVGYEQTRQVAIQVAGDAIDRALALDPRGLVAGHGELKTLAQWNAAPAAPRRYLNALQPAFDTDPRLPSDAGDAAPLPTAAIPVDVDGVH